MAKMLVTYFSKTGNTAQMAEIIAAAAGEVEGVQVDLKEVEAVSPDDLLGYDGIIMGSPTYYGTMAAPCKQLIDESVKHHGKLAGKVGGAFSSSGGPGGGNETTVLDIVKALMIHGMIVKGEPSGDHYGPIAVGAPDERSAEQCRKHGKMLAELCAELFG